MSEECSHAEALIKFLQLFPEAGTVSNEIADLKVPIPIVKLIAFLSEESLDIAAMEEAKGAAAWVKYNRVMTAAIEIMNKKLTGKYNFEPINGLDIVRHAKADVIERLLYMLLMYSLLSPKKQIVIPRIKEMTAPHKGVIQKLIKGAPKAPAKENAEPAVQSTPNPEEKSKPEAPIHDNPAQKHPEEVKYEEILNENQNLKNEINDLMAKVEAAKKRNTERQNNAEQIMEKIAEANSNNFTLDIENDSKRQRIQVLRSLQSQIAQLQKDRDNIVTQIKDLDKRLHEGTRDSIVAQLQEKLTSVRRDSQNDIVDKLLTDRKKLAKATKIMQAEDKKLSARLTGQANTEIIKQRLAFTHEVEAENKERLARARLALTLSQQKLRKDIFQREMRAFL